MPGSGPDQVCSSWLHLLFLVPQLRGLHFEALRGHLIRQEFHGLELDQRASIRPARMALRMVLLLSFLSSSWCLLSPEWLLVLGDAHAPSGADLVVQVERLALDAGPRVNCPADGRCRGDQGFHHTSDS